MTNDEMQPSSEPRTLLGKTAAMSLGASLLLGLAVLLLLTHQDQGRRVQLERAEEVTAVGDVNFFKVPTDAIKPPPRAAVLSGQELYPVSYKLFELPDTRMIRLGRDAATNINIYETAVKVPPQEGEREPVGQKFYFLKVAPKQYVRVRAGTPGK